MNRTCYPVDRLPAQLHLVDGLFTQALAGCEQRLPGQDRESLFTDSTERRRIVDRLVDIEQQHAPHLRRLLLPPGHGLDIGCLSVLLRLLLDLSQVMVESLDEVVAQLPVALPSVAQQIQMGLLWLHSAQIKYCIVMYEAGVVVDVLLRNAQQRQQFFGGMMHRCQRGALLSFRGHHLIAEVLGVLPERGQFGQCVLAHQELPQRGIRLGVQTAFDQFPEAPALCGERVGDDALERGVARPHDLPGFQECQYLNQDESRRDVSPCQQCSRLDQSRPVGPRPEPVAEQFGDLSALRVLLVLSQRLERHRIAGEVTFNQKGHVLGRHRLRGEIEEGVLGLEITYLQQTVEVLDRPLTPLGQSALRVGEGEEFRTLEVVKIRQTIERQPLGWRQHSQPPAVASARRFFSAHWLHAEGGGPRWTRLSL